VTRAEAIDVRDRRHYARIFGSPLEAESLPPWCYSSEAFHRAEQDAIFARSWVCVGRAEQWSGAGAFRALTVADHRLVLVRGDDGELRCFANVCRHRGTRLLDGDGTVRWIRCPFHNWTYGLDGALRAAADMEATAGFDRAGHGLVRYAVKCWNGFVFVRIAGEDSALAETTGDLTAMLAPYRLDDMVTTRTDDYVVPCNWKLFLDVFMEDYHLKAVHGASIAEMYIKPDPPDSGPGYASIWNPHEGTSAIVPEDRPYALPPIEGLTGREAAGTRYVWLYPSLAFAVTIDCLWYFVIEPAGPGETRVAMHMCFPRRTVALNDFPDRAERYYRRFRKVLEEDNAVLARQQEGLASPAALPGRYSQLEPVPSLFAQWLISRIVE
jgi:phenylpropionate dioxygenase-like ring-hydroxylating dioxygenase large terminal subunit